MNFAVWRALAGVLTGAICCQIAVKSLRPEMRSSLDTDALLDGALSRYLRTGWGCKSVMSEREKCDEKNWEDGSDYGTAGAERLQNLSTVTVAPVTSTIRGVPSEVVLNEEDGMKSPCAVNLHNAVTVSQQRLGRRVAQLSAARMNEVCAALRFSLGCESN